MLLRIQVTGGGTSKGRPWPALLGVAAVIGFAVFLATGLESDSTPADPSAGSSPYASYTEDPYAVETEEAHTEAPYAADPSTSEPDASEEPDVSEETDASEETEDAYTEDPYDTASEAPDPYESGTCLNGTLPDSTTAQEVSGVDEVSCSASDAHYQVIETIPLTSDMSRCDANSRTQYALSYRYTLNGATLNEYVYCLIGLGSYAR
ncbi:hypothetical protein ACFWXA_24675 [Streptomyces atroolivaceus]|uniref:LppU/SCO3897 family protein n=1 Tax=Streptomyces atroolivaceus TaxID=66869 RepID=UPI003650EBC6